MNVNLPSGYLKLDYIESTGTQWIETGVYGFASDILEFRGNYTDLTNQGHILGCHNSGRYRRIRLLNYNDVTYFGGACGTWNENTALVGMGHAGTPLTTYGVANTNTHTFIFNHAHNSLSIDGNDYAFQGGFDSANREAPGINAGMHNTMVLFAYRHDSEFDIGSKSNFRLEYAKFTQSGVVTREYIPALRLSDGKPGLYDTVSNTFFVNSATSGEDFKYEIKAYKTIIYDGSLERIDYKTIVADANNVESTNYKTILRR